MRTQLKSKKVKYKFTNHKSQIKYNKLLCEVSLHLLTFGYIFYKNAHNFGLDQYFWTKFSGVLNDNLNIIFTKFRAYLNKFKKSRLFG